MPTSASLLQAREVVGTRTTMKTTSVSLLDAREVVVAQQGLLSSR